VDRIRDIYDGASPCHSFSLNKIYPLPQRLPIEELQIRFPHGGNTVLSPRFPSCRLAWAPSHAGTTTIFGAHLGRAGDAVISDARKRNGMGASCGVFGAYGLASNWRVGLLDPTACLRWDLSRASNPRRRQVLPISGMIRYHHPSLRMYKVL
jgi:hypothetical protein